MHAPQHPERNIQLASTGLPSTSLDEGTHKSQPLPEGTTTDPKDSGGNVQPAYKGLPLTVSNEDKPESSHTQDTTKSASDSSSPELKKYDNILPLNETQLVKYLGKVSKVLFNRITKEQWAQHKEVAVSYADLKASIKGCYKENVDHRYQTKKVIDAAMNSLDKNSIARGDLLNALNG
nr:hypothetical protein [Tanacetum cinerariifolium]